jgi:hypothetical protein
MSRAHPTREQEMARLSRLYTDLARLGVEAPFSMGALEAMDDTRLRKAVRVTQDILLRATKTLAEQ